MSTMSGTEMAKVHSILEFDHCSHWLGITPIEASDGRAVIEMTLRKEMLNGFGIAQGGMLFTFADVAFAMACNEPAGAEDRYTVAQGADVNFLRPGLPDRPLRATAVRRVQQGRSGLYDITVTQQDDDGRELVLLEFRGRSRTVMGAPPIVK
ncbi:hotdog fold thioesterase [Galactobacter caseinivorans]|nr:hotdog fold thioesterase [Galactobacter caseinivorans]